MALVLLDRAQETATANTTVSFTLLGATTGYQTLAGVGNTNTTYYGATDGTNWEVGIGTYSTTGPTLTRTTIFSSSNSGAAVTFSGTVTVFIDYPSAVSTYASNNPGTSGQALVSNGTGVPPSWQSIGGGSAGGSNTQVQYNNSGAFAGNANFTYTGNDVNIPFGSSNSATSSAKIALALSMIA
jgi:hypothetical protein